jgi:hypothetical protein
MAKRKRSGKTPQARHGKKSSPSRHDKRSRLAQPNPQRRSTQSAMVPLVGSLAAVVTSMSQLLDRRNGFRLPIVIAGAILATGRRTASSWFRAAGVCDDWDRFYDLLLAVGKNATSLMTPILSVTLKRLDPGPDGYWKIGIDDSPTKRFGPQVEAANIHHNPTPGPADGPWLYGHNWVCLAMLMQHPMFGVIALPLLSRLYVRKLDVDTLDQRYGWVFRTKLELALAMTDHVMGCLRALGSQAKFMVIFDGAYASRGLVKPLVDRGVTVVSRLRCDAKLFDLPVPTPGKRGRPCVYGKNRISLAKRACHREGWSEIQYACRGTIMSGHYKTFEATSEIVGGPIRVVLLEHASGNWAAYFSTNVTMSAEAILQAASDRWAIEEHFHDVKEVWGAGQQQVRNVWSNIGCWNLCTWLYTLIELESWSDSAEALIDRSDRPWDNPDRRPSHADRRRQIKLKMLRNTFLTDLSTSTEESEIRQRFERLLNLAA